MLVGHIIAHRTKLNPWEFVATKVDITSFVVPNIKHVASIVNLILTLGWDPLGESVFLQVGGFALIAPYCPLLLPLSFWACSPSAFSNPPLLFHPFNLHLPPRLMHTSRRDPFVPNSLLRWCHRCSSRRGQTTVQTTSGHWSRSF